MEQKKLYIREIRARVYGNNLFYIKIYVIYIFLVPLSPNRPRSLAVAAFDVGTTSGTTHGTGDNLSLFVYPLTTINWYVRTLICLMPVLDAFHNGRDSK